MIITCPQCQKEFATSLALQMHQQATHALQGLSKEERQQKRIEFQNQISLHKKQKKWFLYGGITLLILALGIATFFFFPATETFSHGQIHWHTDLAVSICGENIPLPQPIPGTNVHGKPYIGTPFLHLHNEPLIHIEGIVQSPQDITLGRFMEVIDWNFQDTQLLDKKNGDLCPNGQPGKVIILVNGKQDPLLTQKVIVDRERYELRFE